MKLNFFSLWNELFVIKRMETRRIKFNSSKKYRNKSEENYCY